MLVHRKLTPTSLHQVRIFTFRWREELESKVHNTIKPDRPSARTARTGVQLTSHLAITIEHVSEATDNLTRLANNTPELTNLQNKPGKYESYSNILFCLVF